MENKVLQVMTFKNMRLNFYATVYIYIQPFTRLASFEASPENSVWDTWCYITNPHNFHGLSD